MERQQSLHVLKKGKCDYCEILISSSKPHSKHHFNRGETCTHWEELFCPELKVIDRQKSVKDDIKLLRMDMAAVHWHILKDSSFALAQLTSDKACCWLQEDLNNKHNKHYQFICQKKIMSFVKNNISIGRILSFRVVAVSIRTCEGKKDKNTVYFEKHFRNQSPRFYPPIGSL